MKYFFFMLAAAPLSVCCQTLVHAQVISKSTQQAIPFATVGLVKQNNGTTTDEIGSFKIQCRSIEDSIIISAVGFKTARVAVSVVLSASKIELEENLVLLEEVSISWRNKAKPTTLNDFVHCPTNYYSVGLGTYRQVAQRFLAPRASMRLQSIRLCKMAGKATFRVRVYAMDSITGMPSTDLLSKELLINSSDKNVYIDLQENIVLPDRDFFIAVEWLFISSNEFRVKAKIDRQKISYSNYAPRLSFKKLTGIPTQNNCRMLNFNGSWQKPENYDSNHVFMIAAELGSQ